MPFTLNPRPGVIAQIGRAVARTGTRMGYEYGTGLPERGGGVSSRGHHRDEDQPWTQAPTSTRQIYELYRLRNSSRQLFLTAPPWAAFVRFADANVVGADPARLDFGHLQADRRERLADVIEDIRRRWGAYQQEEIGAAGETLRDLARKLLRDALIDGDAFVLPRREGGRWTYQPFPGDALAEQQHSPNPDGTQRELGLEIDTRGRTIAYWFGWQGNFRPLSNLSATAEINTKRIPAEHVMHLIPSARGTQDLRGLPWCHPVIDDLKRIEQFYGSFIRGAIKRAAVGIALTKDAESTFGDETTIDDRAVSQLASTREGTTDENGDARSTIPYQEARSRAGDNLIMEPGYSVTSLGTGAPSPQEADLVKGMERRVVAGLMASGTTLMSDYAGVSFSSGQLARLHERNTVAVLQRFLSRQLYGPIYRNWYRDVWPIILKMHTGKVRSADRDALGMPDIRLKRYEVLEKSKMVPSLLALFQAGLITAAELRDELGMDSSDTSGIVEQALADRERAGLKPGTKMGAGAGGDPPGKDKDKDDAGDDEDEDQDSKD